MVTSDAVLGVQYCVPAMGQTPSRTSRIKASRNFYLARTSWEAQRSRQGEYVYVG